jgi:hypothetical protein
VLAASQHCQKADRCCSSSASCLQVSTTTAACLPYTTFPADIHQPLQLAESARESDYATRNGSIQGEESAAMCTRHTMPQGFRNHLRTWLLDRQVPRLLRACAAFLTRCALKLLTPSACATNTQQQHPGQGSARMERQKVQTLHAR